MKTNKPPVAPTPYSEKGRMVDAIITFCANCSEYAIIKPTHRKFGKESARKVMLESKWRLLGGKWHCQKCSLAGSAKDGSP